MLERKLRVRISLAVQWLGHHTSISRWRGLICGWGAKILHDAWSGSKKNDKIDEF